jgi:hypothetical protein
MSYKNANFNFIEEHQETSLDKLISPLIQAAFLGRIQILEFLA